jgi:hypothetical protein
MAIQRPPTPIKSKIYYSRKDKNRNLKSADYFYDKTKFKKIEDLKALIPHNRKCSFLPF